MRQSITRKSLISGLVAASLFPTMGRAALADSSAPPVPSIIEYKQLIGQGGQVFVSGVSTTLTAANSNVRGLMKNPAGSGKYVFIYELVSAASAFALGSISVDPTAGLPTTALPIENTNIGSTNVPVAQILFDQSTTAMSGGTPTGIPVATSANGVTNFDLANVPIFIIPPGHALGFNIPFSALNTQAGLSIYWGEWAP